MRLLLHVLLLVLLTALPLRAQESDAGDDGEGFLTRTIQDALSDSGRDVDITGFRGALSSRATLERLTIADDEGIWLDLRDAVLDWNRSALLSGRLEVNELTAGSIRLTRIPEGDDTPTPEASGFAIPELPVSVDIGTIKADQVTLGEAVIGEAVTLSLAGSASLDGGGATVDIAVRRTDRPGRFTLKADYDPGQALALDLALSEPEDGIAARLMDIPGRPSVDLTVQGSGPLDDYRADIDLNTDGNDRLDGAVMVSDDGEGGRVFTADLGGDVTALILPEYREFFGTEVALELRGRRSAEGVLDVSEFRLLAAALNLEGSALVDAEGQPVAFDVTGRIQAEDGSRVSLPLGEGISVASTTLDVRFDAREDDAVTGEFAISAPRVPGYAADHVSLELDGSIRTGETPAFGGDLDFAATGLTAEDPAVADALGPEVTGAARIDWTSGGPVSIRGLRLEAENYGARADVDIVPGDGTLELRAEGRAEVARLSAFAGLTGTDLRGAADLALDLRADLVGGTFNVVAEGGTEGLSLGIDQIDPLLSPPATLRLDASRGVDGFELRELRIENEEFRAEAAGTLTNESGQIDYSARLANAGIFTGAQSGPVTLEGTLDQRPDGLYIDGLGTGQDLAIGVPAVDRLLEGGASLTYAAIVTDRIILQNLSVETREAEFTASGELTEGARAIDVAARVENTAIFTGAEAGPLELDAEIRETEAGWRVEATGEGQDIGIGNPTVDPLFAGQTDLSVALTAGERILLERLRLANPQLSLAASGELTEGAREVSLNARLANSAIFTGGRAGPLEVDADIRETPLGWRVEATGEGRDIGIGNPTVDPLLAGRTDMRVALTAGERILLDSLRVQNPQLTLTASGELTEGARDVTLTGQLNNSAIFTGGQAGPLGFEASATQQGPESYALSLDADGQNIGIGNPVLDDLLAGRSDITLRALLEGQTLMLDRFAFDGAAVEADASGRISAEAIDLTLDARLDDIGRVAEGLSGPLTVTGDVGREGETTRLDLRMSGPGGTRATVAGRVLLPGGGVALDIDGQAPLALANAFIAPQSLVGTANFDLRLDGDPAPGSLSGRITTDGARLVLPELQLIAEDISGAVTLASGRANLDLQGRVGGGALAITGPVTLAAPYRADLDVTLNRARFERAGLVSTLVNADMTVTGPLTGGATIGGVVGLNDTEMRIPAGGFGGVEPIPDITHVAEPAPHRRTRARAGLLGENGDGGPTASGPGFGLDLLIRTDESIFLRGRGLDAELQGRLRLEGTTNDMRPVGSFELVRGRLNILTKRLDLVEGRLRLQGGFEPYIRLVARNRGQEYIIDIVVEGPASAPDVTFSSQPELPEDEVLSQLFFDRELQSLSVLQAAKLAAAVAELTGSGNGGVVGRIRGAFGLDDLDISQTEEGETSVRVGKYLSDNVYTDVEVTGEGETNLSINLDVTDDLTAKGQVSDDGETSLGIFYERDY